MKFLTYYYYFSRQNIKKNLPERNPHSEAIKTVSFPVAMVLACTIFRIMLETDIWKLVIEHWPYEYGNIHSKNFIAPTGVIPIVIYFFTGRLIKFYFCKVKIQQAIKFDYELGIEIKKIDEIIPEILTFSLVFLGIFIAVGFWWVSIIFLILLLILEGWIRRRLDNY